MQTNSQKAATALDKVRSRNLFNHAALIDMLVEVIKSAVVIGMRDLPKLTITKIRIVSKVDTIDRAAKEIRKEISNVVSLTEESKDFMENEHAYEVYRLCMNMAFMNTDDLREFNDGVDKQRKE